MKPTDEQREKVNKLKYIGCGESSETYWKLQMEILLDIKDLLIDLVPTELR